jgi:hypothetical protein
MYLNFMIEGNTFFTEIKDIFIFIFIIIINSSNSMNLIVYKKIIVLINLKVFYLLLRFKL